MKEKHKRRIKKGRENPIPSRRQFLVQGALALGVGSAIGAWQHQKESPLKTDELPIRPPTADADDQTFQQKCIRCGLCGLVCENGCIGFFGINEGDKGRLTPFLDVRKRSCTLCMRCTQICPSGALEYTDQKLDLIFEKVKMGVARVEPDLCLSYLGRVCGYCHDACPYPQKAIKLVPPATPVILEDGCIGCGRCVELCPQVPTAIQVVRKQSV